MDIKICGLTCLEDALAALRFGADYLGFVFYENSPRAVTASQVRTISRGLPAKARLVGVFVDVMPARAWEAAAFCGLCAVQLHGEEAAADFCGGPLPMWRAVRFCGGEPLPAPAVWPAERYVADSRADGAGHTGGSGRLTDWAAAGKLAARFPVMLAGGLCPENVAEALEVVRPCGVDIAGGVEIPDCPGRKDHAKMKRFIEIVKANDAKRQPL